MPRGDQAPRKQQGRSAVAGAGLQLLVRWRRNCCRTSKDDRSRRSRQGDALVPHSGEAIPSVPVPGQWVSIPVMGQPDWNKTLVEHDLARAKEVRRVADYVIGHLTRSYADVARRDGMSVREFATLAGLSKSDAGRAMKAGPDNRAVHPGDIETINQVVAIIREEVYVGGADLAL